MIISPLKTNTDLQAKCPLSSQKQLTILKTESEAEKNDLEQGNMAQIQGEGLHKPSKERIGKRTRENQIMKLSRCALVLAESERC